MRLPSLSLLSKPFRPLETVVFIYFINFVHVLDCDSVRAETTRKTHHKTMRAPARVHHGQQHGIRQARLLVFDPPTVPRVSAAVIIRLCWARDVPCVRHLCRCSHGVVKGRDQRGIYRRRQVGGVRTTQLHLSAFSRNLVLYSYV